MRTLARIAIFGGALACALAASQWLADPGLRRIPPAPAPRAEAQPTPPPLSEAAEPLIAFGGAYGEASAGVSVDEGRVHYALGAELLHLGDSYSAASHLALARTALGDYGRICELLAVAYDTLNMTLDLLEIMDCLEREAQQRHSAKALFERLSRQLDVEFEFQAAASDHFVASFPSRGPSAAAIGEVLDLLETARRRVQDEIGFASMRLVPVVVYEGDQFAAATDKPHWAAGLYDGKIRFAIETYRAKPDFFEMSITHEYVHALTHEYTGTRLPSWFREGLADVLARRGPAAQRMFAGPLGARAQLLDLYELRGSFTELPTEEAGRAYRQSFQMVHNLVREAGWGAVTDLLFDLYEDRELGFDDAFRDLYGESPADYLDRWYDLTLP
jgi:hypothetical protein